MKFLFLFLSLFSFPFYVFSQDSRKSVSICFGAHQTNSNGQLDYYSNDEGSYVLQQKKATFFDLTVLVSKSGIRSANVQGKSFNLKRLGLVYGLGLNQKGFIQTGMASDGTSNYYPYTITLKRTYLSLYLGAFYSPVMSKKINISLGFLLNPDFDIQRITEQNSYFKPVALSSRSYLAIRYALTPELGIALSPYFQYALSNYYQRLKNVGSTDYKPFGFGLNLGLSF